MSDTTPILALPYILPSQAQKHVTHNEALRVLDAVVQLVVLSSDRTQPPVSTVAGARYVVALGATGDWAGQDAKIAVFEGDGWVFFQAQPGWRAEDLSLGRQIRFDGTAWATDTTALDGLDRLGIGTSADPTNRLAVVGPATLLSHDGSDHRLKINKSTPVDTASLIFQSGWSGRAELGLSGTEDLSIKVSADGVTFAEALSLDRHTGAVRAPANPAFCANTPGLWTTITSPQTDLLFTTASLNRGNHYDPVLSRFVAPTGALYGFLLNGVVGPATDATLCYAINGLAQDMQTHLLVGAAPLSFMAILALNEGDIVTCRTGNGTTNLTYLQESTSLSGWLIS